MRLRRRFSVDLGKYGTDRKRSIQQMEVTNSDLAMVYDTLNLISIYDFTTHSFSGLSAGQHQKIMFARGPVQESNVTQIV